MMDIAAICKALSNVTNRVTFDHHVVESLLQIASTLTAQGDQSVVTLITDGAAVTGQ